MKFAEKLYNEIAEAIARDEPAEDIIEDIEDSLVKGLPFKIIEESLVYIYLEGFLDPDIRPENVNAGEYLGYVANDLADISEQTINTIKDKLVIE